MNRQILKTHRQMVFLDAFNVYMDKVEGKSNPNPEYLEEARKRLKYRAEKLREVVKH